MVCDCTVLCCAVLYCNTMWYICYMTCLLVEQHACNTCTLLSEKASLVDKLPLLDKTPLVDKSPLVDRTPF